MPRTTKCAKGSNDVTDSSMTANTVDPYEQQNVLQDPMMSALNPAIIVYIVELKYGSRIERPR